MLTRRARAASRYIQLGIISDILGAVSAQNARPKRCLNNPQDSGIIVPCAAPRFGCDSCVLTSNNRNAVYMSSGAKIKPRGQVQINMFHLMHNTHRHKWNNYTVIWCRGSIFRQSKYRIYVYQLASPLA